MSDSFGSPAVPPSGLKPDIHWEQKPSSSMQKNFNTLNPSVANSYSPWSADFSGQDRNNYPFNRPNGMSFVQTSGQSVYDTTTSTCSNNGVAINNVESLNSFPVSDLIRDDALQSNSMAAEQPMTVSSSLQSPGVYVKTQPSFYSNDRSFIDSETREQMPERTCYVPQIACNPSPTLPRCFDSTSVSALRAVGLSGYQNSYCLPSPQIPDSQQHRQQQQQRLFYPSGPIVKEEIQSPESHSNQITYQSGEPQFVYPQSHFTAPVNRQDYALFSNSSTVQSQAHYSDRCRNLASNTQQSSSVSSSAVPRPQPSTYVSQYQSGIPPNGYEFPSFFAHRHGRERYLSAPGGSLGRMQVYQGCNASFNSSECFTDDRSRSSFDGSRSSSAGGVDASQISPSNQIFTPTKTKPSYSNIELVHCTSSQIPTIQQFSCGEPVSDSKSGMESGVFHPSYTWPGQSTSLPSVSYFWQYNTQSKQRSHRSANILQDPYCIEEDFRDPIFESGIFDCPQNQVDQQLRHPGKARRGDGTDTTPNPSLLFCIGNMLAQLNNEINGIHALQQQADVHDLDWVNEAGCNKLKHPSESSDSANILSSTRREKNMLASRVCRLKRKAQHEANKIVMAGLKAESEQVLRSIASVEGALRDRLLSPQTSSSSPSSPNADSMKTYFEDFRLGVSQLASLNRCAGRTSEFVMDVLRRVQAGDPTGGLPPPVAISSDAGGDDSGSDSELHLVGPKKRVLSVSHQVQTIPRKRHHSSHPQLIGNTGQPPSEHNQMTAFEPSRFSHPERILSCE